MNFLRINEISNQAKLGIVPALDDFEQLELIETAAKMPTIQDSVGCYLSDIKDYSGNIESYLKKAKLQIDAATELLKANKDDFDECFFDAFTENLTGLQNLLGEIENESDDIHEYAQKAKSEIYNESF